MRSARMPEMKLVYRRVSLLGRIAARAGGAKISIGAIRVTFWGALAMALTAGVGSLFGVVA